MNVSDPAITDNLRGLVYAEDKQLFVAVGDQGAVVTSANGQSWIKQPSNTTAQLNGIAYGDGTFVAVGEDGTILYSTDGTSWAAGSIAGVDMLTSVAYGAGAFVAVGYESSTDSGLIYSIAKTDLDSSVPGSAVWSDVSPQEENSFYDVVFGGGYFQAGSIFGISRSTDGSVWSIAGSPASYIYNTAYLAETNQILMLATDFMDDTLNMISIYNSAGSSESYKNVGAKLNSMAYANGQYLAVGADGSFARFTIAESGGEYDFVGDVQEAQEPGIDAELHKVVFGAGKFIAVGDDGTILAYKAEQLQGLSLTPGTTAGTVKVSALPAGSYKYTIGAPGSWQRPLYGDASSAYASLTGSTEIPAVAGQHLYVVKVDDNDRVIGWSEIEVAQSDIGSQGPSSYLYYLTSDGNSSNAGSADALMRIGTDGSDETTIATEIAKIPGDLTIDIAGGQAYYFAGESNEKSIRRIDLGSGAKTDFISPLAQAPSYTGLFFDSAHGYLYYLTNDSSSSTISAGDSLRRINQDGTGDILIAGNIAKLPGDLAMDIGGGKAYFFDGGAGNYAIRSVDLATQNVGLVTTLSAITAYSGLVFNPADGYIYFLSTDGNSDSSGSEDALKKIKPDGTGLTTIASSVAANPGDLSIDFANRIAYFFDIKSSSAAIKKVDLDSGALSTFKPQSGMAYAGIYVTSGQPVSFDRAASSPADDATDVDLAADLSLKFSGKVLKGIAGNFIITDLTSNTVLETIANGSSQIAGWGTDTLTINPSGDLPAGHKIAVTWEKAVVQDYYNSFIAANSLDSNYNFTVAGTAGGSATFTVVNTDDSGTGSLRWAIAQAGAAADGKVVFDPALAGQTITLQSDLTEWDHVSREAATISSSSNSSFTLTGLKDADGKPAITVNGNGHMGIYATGNGEFSASDIKLTGFDMSAADGLYDTLGSALTTGNYDSVHLSNVQFESNTMTSKVVGSIVSLGLKYPFSGGVHLDRVVFADNTLEATVNDASNGPLQSALLFNSYVEGDVTNSLFSNNIAISNTAMDSYGAAISGIFDYNLDIINNTFYGNRVVNNGSGSAFGPVGVVNSMGGSVINLYNNIWTANEAKGTKVTALGDIFFNAGATLNDGHNAATVSPFIDAAGGDFRLASVATEAIDQGDDSKSVGSLDLAGKARKVGSAVDIGAYEYVPGPVSNDASLTSVLGQTDAAPGGGSGVYGDPITWSINAANNVTKLDKADIVSADSTARVWFYADSTYAGNDGNGVRSLNLPEDGSAIAYIQIDSGSATLYYAVTISRAGGAAAPAYKINGVSQPWQNATLAADGDVLEITTDDSPASPVLVHVTAPAGSTVTLKGKAGKTYDKVYVLVDEPITLKLENFNIKAPAGDSYNGIGFVKDNSPGDVVLEVAGSNTIEGFNGIFSRSNHQLTIKGTGTLIAKGRTSADPAADSGNGIYMKSDKTSGNTNPVAGLTVDGGVTVEAYGGDSTGASGGNGIWLDWGNLLIKNGSVTASGGQTDGDRTALSAGSGVTRRGGAGVYLEEFGSQGQAGKLTIKGGMLTANGGAAQAVNDRGDYYEGGRGINAYNSTVIEGGSVTAKGGASAAQRGGDGIFTPALTIAGPTTSVTTLGGDGGTGASYIEAGAGMYVTNDIDIDGSDVTAAGGRGMANEYGIFSAHGSLTITGQAEVSATGGNGTATGGSGGMAVRVYGDISVSDSSKITAAGGDGQVNGSHGVFADTGHIGIYGGAAVTALGGNGTSGVGGAGLRAFGGGSGSAVDISEDAGDIYVRGGQGMSAKRASIIAKDVRIATGNVGPIVMEGTGNPRSIRNMSGGDDVYLLTVTTDPAAATTIRADVNGTASGAYTYRAPAKADGLAYMWLPAGARKIEAAGYQHKLPNVTTDDAAFELLTLPAPIAHLAHGGVTTDYTTIQAAIDAAADGDTVAIEAGTHREQLTITKNITLQGAGIAQTIIESPDADALAAGSWKNLKNQLVYAVIGVKTASAGEVVIKDLTIDGRKQGYISSHNGYESVYTFNGIAVRDTSATIDHVKVVDVRDAYSDYSGSPVAPLPGDYVPQDQPSGANHNESILLEGAAGTGPHKVTVQNSQIVRFHKTGILAWGPTLEVDIHDNEIQGHGKTLYSTGNGIQIASTDRSTMGGSNGDRRGTTGIVKDNHIYDIGLVIPEPGETGAYLNLGLYGPTGILMYEAGDGFIIEGNTLTGPSVPAWHNSSTSNDGGYSNDGIGFTNVKDPVIKNNTISGFGTAILEGGAVAGSKATIEGNTLSGNEIDIWTSSGDDAIKLGAGAETIAYNQTGNGIDTIEGFGVGDRLNVVGFVNGSVNGQIGTPANVITMTGTEGNPVIIGYTDAHPVVDFTGGTVTAGSGTSVAARSVEVSESAGVTTLYIDTDNDAGAPELTIKLTGVYAPGNFRLNGGCIEFVPNSTADASSKTFDKNTADTTAGHYEDVVVNLTLNGNTLDDVLLNGASIGSGNYTIDGTGKLTIKKAYLASLSEGAHTFTLDMSGGADLTLVVTVSMSATPETTPNATIDYAAEKLTGLTPNAAYTIGGVSKTADAEGKLSLESGWLGTSLSIVKSGNGSTKTDSAAQSLAVPARTAAPTSVGKTDATYPGATDGKLTGVTTQMEYRLSPSGVWIAITGTEAAGLTAGTYEVRVAATSTAFASAAASVTIGETPTTQEATPNATIDYTAEKLTGLTPNAAYTIGGVSKTADADGKLSLESGWLGTSLSIVKNGNGSTKTDSAAQSLAVPARTAAPTSVGKTDATYPGATDGKLTGVTTQMEYRLSPSGVWTAITGTEAAGLAAGTYEVRVAATSTAFASAAASVTIGETPTTQEATPNATIDYTAEKLTGLTPNAAYTIGGVSKTADADGKLSLESGWLGTSLSIVKPGNGSTKTDSAAQSLSVPARPATPTVVGKTEATYPGATDGKLTGVTNEMEYRLSPSGVWTAITGTEAAGLTAGTYEVRVAATSTAFASAAASVTIGETPTTQEATPNATIDYTAEKLTGLTPNAAYTIGGVSKTADADGKLSLESGWLGTSLSIVKSGNGSTKTDSAAQSLAVPARTTAPTVVGKTDATYPGATDGKLTGVTNEMEYRLSPSGVWIAITGTEVAGLAAGTYEVRVAATSTAFASAAVSVTIGETPTTQEATPNATIDYTAEKLTGLTPNAAYTIGGVSKTADADGKLALEASWLGTTISIVKPGNGSTKTDSAPQALNVPARPGHPAVTANDDANTINGLDTSMEFAIDDGAYVKFNGTNTPELSGAHTVKVRTAATAAALAGEAKSLTFTINAPSPSSGSSDASASSTEQAVEVLVNGKAENAGKATTTESGGIKTTDIVVDPAKLQAKLDAEGSGAIVTIPVKSDSNVIVGELNGQMIKNMEKQSATLVLKTDKATYTLPAEQINIDALSGKLGGNVKLEDIKVRVTIAETPSSMARIVANAATGGKLSIVAPAIDFTVTGTYNGKTVEVTTFNAYVERTVALPEGVDPSRITTGIVVDPDGTVRHVPTKITVIDGKYYAQINSLTNSTYAVVWHPMTFADVSQHWAKDAVNDMGSRLVINGVNETTFNPNADITRAEFAAIIVRGLGLRLGEGTNPFADVASGAWYASAVQTAATYGLITGFEDGTFRPNAKITREQAMAIVAKAMKLTGLAQQTGTPDTAATLGKFADGAAAADWARDSIALAAQAGLVSGRNGGKLEAKANVTRAEVATLIQRLLKQSDLI
ncbi:S-layer homology domain-containing protein [Cohnella sp. 56]|uniref:S-layer homology domain-containing protein n=1 Tax=Cohnella sp. 56 TaxID=3113722 RepID=UPI0030E7A904